MGRRTTFSLALISSLGGLSIVYAGIKVSQYLTVRRKRQRMLKQYRQQLIPDRAQQNAIRSDFFSQLEYGLQAKIPANGRHMLMLPSYVTALPTGLEHGDSYAIDLGGTNFRVLHVRLSKEPSKLDGTDMREMSIPQAVYTGPGHQLFDFLATKLRDFILEHTKGAQPKEPPVVGFCFSFPMDQTSLTQGILLDWTKGFKCTGVIGNDPVALLNEALERAGMPCRVSALLNDTIGVWAAQRYFDPRTSIGVVLGTGTNACYVLPVERLTKWQPQDPSLKRSDAQTVINVEWGAFESERLPRIAEDSDVDASTLHAGKYLFEKLVSGMFLGDVGRRILMSLAAETKLLGDYSVSQDAARVFARLATPGSFTAVYMSAIVKEAMEFDSLARKPKRDILPVTAEMLQQSIGAGPAEAPPSTRIVVKDVCKLVALRSAMMVATALDALLTHSGWKDSTLRALAAPAHGATDPSSLATTIAIDGGVYSKFGGYRAMLDQCMLDLLGPELHPLVQIKLTQDGSSLGAVVLAEAAAEAERAKTKLAQSQAAPAGPA